MSEDTRDNLWIAAILLTAALFIYVVTGCHSLASTEPASKTPAAQKEVAKVIPAVQGIQKNDGDASDLNGQAQGSTNDAIVHIKPVATSQPSPDLAAALADCRATIATLQAQNKLLKANYEVETGVVGTITDANGKLVAQVKQDEKQAADYAAAVAKCQAFDAYKQKWEASWLGPRFWRWFYGLSIFFCVSAGLILAGAIAIQFAAPEAIPGEIMVAKEGATIFERILKAILNGLWKLLLGTAKFIVALIPGIGHFINTFISHNKTIVGAAKDLAKLVPDNATSTNPTAQAIINATPDNGVVVAQFSTSGGTAK